METTLKGDPEWKMKNKILSENPITNSKPKFLKTVSIGFSEALKRGSSRATTLTQSIKTTLKTWLCQLKLHLKELKEKVTRMLGPLEKGIQAAKVSTPPVGTYEGVDLRTLPKFISFKAAMLHNKMTLQFVIAVMSFLFLGMYLVKTKETLSLYEKLRTKEYILAPGVQDFTPASPDTVSDEYVSDAVNDLVSLLGNTSPSNIKEQYKSLSDIMSPQLKPKFLSESAPINDQTKTDGISEIFNVTGKEIVAHDDGTFQVTVFGKRDRYINNEYVGKADEVLEIVLELIPPKKQKRWFLQIDSLVRESVEIFSKKKRN